MERTFILTISVNSAQKPDGEDSRFRSTFTNFVLYLLAFGGMHIFPQLRSVSLHDFYQYCLHSKMRPGSGSVTVKRSNAHDVAISLRISSAKSC